MDDVAVDDEGVVDEDVVIEVDDDIVVGAVAAAVGNDGNTGSSGELLDCGGSTESVGTETKGGGSLVASSP